MPSFDKIPVDPPKTNGGSINPIIFTRYDICPNCNAQRLVLLSFNGYSQNYKDAVDAYLYGYKVLFDRYEIRSMKCKSCSKEFTIDWSDGFPKPLQFTQKIRAFFQEFIEGR